MSITATAQFISNVIQSVALTHIEHLGTYDYALHKTLDEYYKKMPEHIDVLAETFLGTNGKIKTLPAPQFNSKGSLQKDLIILLAQGEKLNEGIPTSAIRTGMDNVLNFMAHINYKLQIKGCLKCSTSSNPIKSDTIVPKTRG